MGNKTNLKGALAMITLLAKLLLRNTNDPIRRRRVYGILCSTVGIFLNLLLFAAKCVAGVVSGSIAVMADAFNNLSDGISSAVTLLGFELAGQRADKEHPFGHGRMEYLSGLAVAILMILMGFELAKSSVEIILHPKPLNTSPLTLWVLLAAIGIKLYIFGYNRRIGDQVNSPAMMATAMDALGDCAATAAVLVSTLAEQYTSLRIDGWCGILVAGFILLSGIQAVKSTLDPLLGQPPSKQFVNSVRTTALAHKEVLGIHDLIVHDYGPDRRMISLHAEVPASGNIVELHDRIDKIERELKENLGCEAVIHMDPVVTDDVVTAETRERINTLVRCIDDEISIHDFRMAPGSSRTNVMFDAVVPFHFRLSDREVAEKISAAVRTLDGNYYAIVQVERSYT